MERVRTEHVVVGAFRHGEGDAATSVESWRETCSAFTTFGSWRIRSRRGGGALTPGVVLVSEGWAEHDCRHPDGMDDRMLCVLYRAEVDPGPALLVPQVPVLYSLRRSLVAQLRRATPDPEEVEALGLALLEAVREAPAGRSHPGPRARAAVDRVRAHADSHYREPDLDLVALELGLSRTRFVHLFRDVMGVTPHRYILELRATHAARLLRDTSMSVTEICFDSGFGSLPSFYAAFRSAYGLTPGTYQGRGGGAHFS